MFSRFVLIGPIHYVGSMMEETIQPTTHGLINADLKKLFCCLSNFTEIDKPPSFVVGLCPHRKNSIPFCRMGIDPTLANGYVHVKLMQTAKAGKVQNGKHFW